MTESQGFWPSHNVDGLFSHVRNRLFQVEVETTFFPTIISITIASVGQTNQIAPFAQLISHSVTFAYQNS